MKFKIIIIILLLSVFNFSNAQVKSNDKTYYTCVMHPEIHENKPGDCPKCGMTLIKVKSKSSKKTLTKKPIVTKKVISETKKKVIETKKETTTSPVKNTVPENNIKTKTISKTVRYDLYVRDTIVTIGNKPKRAIAVNGQIPMPTLTFTEGDTAEIYVHNELKESTSLHWHGLMLPNKEDGVPYEIGRAHV